MSISASTMASDNIIRDSSNPGRSIFEDGKAATTTAVGTWNQGDLIAFDVGQLSLRAVTATGDAVTFVGVADNSVTLGQLNSPYQGLTPVNAAQVTPGFVGPMYSVSARLNIHLGDSLNIGQKVYLSNGDTAQYVTATDPGDHNYVGIFVGLKPIVSAVAGQNGDILIGARYPRPTGADLIF